MNRRGFLGALMASLVGTAIAPSEVLWMPSPEKGLPIVAPHAFLTLQQITHEVGRLMAKRIALPVSMAPDGLLLGSDGMTKLVHVLMPVPRELGVYGLDSDRYIKPVAEALTSRTQLEGWDRFGELPIRIGGCDVARWTRCTGKGVSVRGVMSYDPGFDEYMLRFDVLGRAA